MFYVISTHFIFPGSFVLRPPEAAGKAPGEAGLRLKEAGKLLKS